MLKLCGDSINRPLATIFNERIFPNDWKKANGVAIHKKNDKQIVTSYRFASLLPVCSKIFEWIIHNAMYINNLYNNLDNNLLLPN